MLFEDYYDFKKFTFRITPIIDHRFRAMCAKPYHGHPKGCPKFYKNDKGCPPLAPLFENYFDLTFPIFAIVNEFDIKSQMAKMLRGNPNWTEYQQANCLYWQKGARNILLDKVNYVLSLNRFSNNIYTMCPEAMGLNVTETLRRIGINLEWPPRIIARQVAIIGVKNDASKTSFSS